jgi:hypothetical protein
MDVLLRLGSVISRAGLLGERRRESDALGGAQMYALLSVPSPDSS